MEFSRTGTMDLLRVRLLLPGRILVSVGPILSTCDGSNVFISILAIYFVEKTMDTNKRIIILTSSFWSIRISFGIMSTTLKKDPYSCTDNE